MLDSLYVYKQQMNAEIAKSINFGNDPIFIGRPSGEKIFIGMGQLSFEKWIEKNW